MCRLQNWTCSHAVNGTIQFNLSFSLMHFIMVSSGFWRLKKRAMQIRWMIASKWSSEWKKKKKKMNRFHYSEYNIYICASNHLKCMDYIGNEWIFILLTLILITHLDWSVGSIRSEFNSLIFISHLFSWLFSLGSRCYYMAQIKKIYILMPLRS